MKLVAIGPSKKEKESEVVDLEHIAYTPAPPVPKIEGLLRRSKHRRLKVEEEQPTRKFNGG